MFFGPGAGELEAGRKRQNLQMYTAKVFYRIVISSSYIADREKDLLLFVIGSF